MEWLNTLWEAIRSFFSPSPPQSPVQPCANAACANAISPERAQQVFDQLAANKSIPFDYPPDCCYARASEMVTMMDTMGVPSRKVWTYGTLVPMASQASPVRFPPNGGQQVTWRYHVAPVVDVAQPDGSTLPMVMDPSLSSRPLTVQEWNQIMSGPGANVAQTAFTDTSVFYRDSSGSTFPEPPNGRHDAFASHIATRDAALNP